MYPQAGWSSYHSQWTSGAGPAGGYGGSPRYGRFGGSRPSRLFWFIVGGASVAWWMKGHSNRNGFWCNSKASERQIAWEEKKEKLDDLRHQATSTAVEVTDTSIDSALSALQTLKNKLSERRSLLDAQEQQRKRALDDERRI